LIVDDKDTVQQRSITTDRALGDQWLVSAGVTPGDRVVVEGSQKVRAGVDMKVRVVPFLADQPKAATAESKTQPATKSN
jgi:membrane fusion protein (multidrug efflux system)